MNSKRVIAVILAGTMIISSVVPAFAAENTSEKEEVIYINLDSKGTVKDIYAVNIFGKGDVVDYGDYDSVEMLNVNAEINQNGDKLTFSTDKDRVYYQGNMKSKEIPWNISVRYFLDGKEYSAGELAGKSGNLEIRFKITENKSFKGDFFDHYALQASFTLDTEKCDNIVADNATLANVGSDKQISYTILPGKGIDAVVTADVKDFEMSAIAINGIPLSMDIEVEDEELMDQVTELLDAIEKLDDGAEELKDGVSELQDGAQGDLQSGVKELKVGASQLHSGAGELKQGGSSLKTGTSDLQSGAASLDGGFRSLNAGIREVQAGLNQLNEKSSELTQGSAQVYRALQEIQSALNGVSASSEEISTLTQASSQIKDGIEGLAAGASELQNNTSFAAYKAIMQANGLNIDELRAGNEQGAAQMQCAIDKIDAILGTLQSMPNIPEIPGVSLTPDVVSGLISELTDLRNQLAAVQSLFIGNNANIDGMEAYLGELNKGMGELASGAAQLQNSYQQFHEGIMSLADTLSDLLVNVSQLSGAINTLTDEYGKLDAGIQEYTNGVAQIIAGYSQITKGSSALVQGSGELVKGSSSLYSGTEELLNGIVAFYDATGSLKNGTGELDDGVAELLAGIAQLNDGTIELKDGTGQLREETDGMDTEISDKIDDMLASFTGEDFETVSFTSEKNTNVDSVQFVIQTEAVEKIEMEEEEETEEEPKTFVEKLKELFR